MRVRLKTPFYLLKILIKERTKNIFVTHFTDIFAFVKHVF